VFPQRSKEPPQRNAKNKFLQQFLADSAGTHLHSESLLHSADLDVTAQVWKCVEKNVSSEKERNGSDAAGDCYPFIHKTSLARFFDVFRGEREAKKRDNRRSCRTGLAYQSSRFRA
jgi:hypothetical protein